MQIRIAPSLDSRSPRAVCPWFACPGASIEMVKAPATSRALYRSGGFKPVQGVGPHACSRTVRFVCLVVIGGGDGRRHGVATSYFGRGGHGLGLRGDVACRQKGIWLRQYMVEPGHAIFSF